MRCLEKGSRSILIMHFMLLRKDLINSFQEQQDYEGFKLAAIVNFGIDTTITQQEFEKGQCKRACRKIIQEAITQLRTEK